MDRQDEVYLDIHNSSKSSNDLKVQAVSRLYSALGSINIAVLLVFPIYLLYVSKDIMNVFIYNVFSKIPYLGQLAYMGIQSLNLIDLSVLHSKVFNPLLLVEVVYYTVPLIIAQGVLLGLKRRLLRHDHTYFSILLLFVIALTAIMVNQMDLVLIMNANHSLLELRNLLFRIFLWGQLLCVGTLVYLLYQKGRFQFRGFDVLGFSSRVIKISAITSLLMLVIAGSGLGLVNLQVDGVKEAIAVDYVLDLKPTADGLVHLVMPDLLIQKAQGFGINIPKEIEGGMILQQVFVDNIDFGAIINQTAGTFIDGLSARFISKPMMRVIIMAVLIGMIVFLPKILRVDLFKEVWVRSIQLVLALILNLRYAFQFGQILSIFTLWLFMGIFIQWITVLDLKDIKLKISALRHKLQ